MTERSNVSPLISGLNRVENIPLDGSEQKDSLLQRLRRMKLFRRNEKSNVPVNVIAPDAAHLTNKEPVEEEGPDSVPALRLGLNRVENEPLGGSNGSEHRRLVPKLFSKVNLFRK